MLKEQRLYTSRSKQKTRTFEDAQFSLTFTLGEDHSLEQFQLQFRQAPRNRKITWNRVAGTRDSEARNLFTKWLIPPQPIEPLISSFESKSQHIDQKVREHILSCMKELRPKGASFLKAGAFSTEGSLSITRKSSEKDGKLSDEVMAKVKKIELGTKKRVDDLMSGSYKSQFKGHGVQFSEHRVYLPGDDVRHIDWKVSARTREPLLKKFEEERELTVFLVVDVSGSKNFGTKDKLKSEMVAEIAGMIAYAASHTGDKVGVLLFAGEVEKIIPPKKGKQHIQRVIRDILLHEPTTGGTDLGLALKVAHRMMKHSGIVFVISDFLTDNYFMSLKQLSRKNDVIAVWTQDPREKEFPKINKVRIKNPETGKEFYVNPNSYAFQTWHQQFVTQQRTKTEDEFKACGVEVTEVSTHENYLDSIARFFRIRKRRG